MQNGFGQILAKHEDDGFMPLSEHLSLVALSAETIARNVGLDVSSARKGAILHDIGKVSPVFQNTLRHGYVRPAGFIFRHEIASLFFLSLVEENERNKVLEMVVAHHKSVYKDAGELGLLDLDDLEDSFTIHSKGFESWSPIALGILDTFGFTVHEISIEEAKENYDYAVSYCNNIGYGYSKWRGLLMEADHMASALGDLTVGELKKSFIVPDLTFYNRRNDLFPLSMKKSESDCKHTIVTAPTGAGKTDFLLRRCKGRVFYTLPFQASINAMYDRFKTDLKGTNAQIRLLHASSGMKLQQGKWEERIMQQHAGASIKVMTPHQLASIAFGIKGYEAMLVDLAGCDVILDEIHTYSCEIQAIVLRIIEILVNVGCRVHVGTATMPKVLYDRILAILGGPSQVYEVALPEDELSLFNRHEIHKAGKFDEVRKDMDSALQKDQKILVVCNQVRRAQELYSSLKAEYPNIPIMLIHSHFKRKDRQQLEEILTNRYSAGHKACIVVSTQVVEVSLDINFDMMITECAPIDAMIQRFGRVNRKRTRQSIGRYKPIYVLYPHSGKEALPYKEEILRESYDVLPDNSVLEEKSIQEMLDAVYPDDKFMNIDYSVEMWKAEHTRHDHDKFMNIDYSGVAFKDGKWVIKKLRHNAKSVLMDFLDMNSAVCIVESDVDTYRKCNDMERSAMEIPVSFQSVRFNDLQVIEKGSYPFVVPDLSYSNDNGLDLCHAKPEYCKHFEFL